MNVPVSKKKKKKAYAFHTPLTANLSFSYSSSVALL